MVGIFFLPFCTANNYKTEHMSEPLILIMYLCRHMNLTYFILKHLNLLEGNSYIAS